MDTPKTLTVRGDDPLDLTQFEGHTPGPWTVEFVNRPTGGDDYEGVAIIKIGKHTVILEPCEEAEDDINANLLAAAPRLLAECARLRAEIVGYRKDYSGAIEEDARLRERHAERQEVRR